MDGVKLANDIEKLNGEQIKAAQEALKTSMELKGRVISGVRALPPEQRDAAYQVERANLVASGVPSDQLPPKWDENAADSLVQQSLTVAEALNMKREAAQLAETVRHNKAAEGNAAGNLAVSRGHLAISNRADQRAANAPSGVYPVQSKADYDGLPSGTHYSAPDGTVRVKP